MSLSPPLPQPLVSPQLAPLQVLELSLKEDETTAREALEALVGACAPCLAVSLHVKFAAAGCTRNGADTGSLVLATPPYCSAPDIVDTHPLFMRPYAAPAAEAMLTIVAHEQFEPETRRLGIEFLLQFAEKAPATGALDQPSCTSS